MKDSLFLPILRHSTEPYTELMLNYNGMQYYEILDSVIPTSITESSAKIASTSVMDYSQISVFVSILIFLLGFFVNEVIRRRNKAKDIENHKLFLLEWVDKSIPTLTSYIISLQKFSKDIEKNNDLNIAKWETNIIKLGRMNNYPTEKYAEIFIFGNSHKDYNEKRKMLMNMLYQIEYLEKVQDIIMNTYKDYTHNNAEIMNEWNSCYSQIQGLFATYSLQKNNYPDAEIVVMNNVLHFFMLLASHSKREFAGMDQWLNKFIKPSIIILRKFIDDNHNYSDMLYNALSLILRLDLVHLKYEKHKEYSKVFGDYVYSLTVSKDIINASQSFFCGCKTRYYVR